MTDSSEPDLTDLSGRTAVVTGGANGIGRAIVEALLDEGASVVIADIEAPVLEATVTDLAERGQVIGVRTDVSDPDSVEALADAVYERFGACHLLFNNAGVTSGGGGKPWEQEYNDFRWCFGVNVFGSANGVAAFVPRMIASGEPGRVINTSSGDGGFAPVPRASVYAASKAAVRVFHRGAGPQPHLRGDQRARLGLLSERRAHGHRAVHRQPQPSGRVGPQRGGYGTAVDDVRGTQGGDGEVGP